MAYPIGGIRIGGWRISFMKIAEYTSIIKTKFLTSNSIIKDFGNLLENQRDFEHFSIFF